jgi:hypothetical protein
MAGNTTSPTFPFGAARCPTVTTLLSAVAVTGAGGAVPGVAGPKTFQATGTTASGSGAAAVAVQGSLDGVNFDTIGTITLTLGVASSSDSFAFDECYAAIRGNVTSISGTGAVVNLYMGT